MEALEERPAVMPAAGNIFTPSNRLYFLSDSGYYVETSEGTFDGRTPVYGVTVRDAVGRDTLKLSRATFSRQQRDAYLEEIDAMPKSPARHEVPSLT